MNRYLVRKYFSTLVFADHNGLKLTKNTFKILSAAS